MNYLFIFFLWIGLPIWIIVLIVLSIFVSIIKDTNENKFNVIKKMWFVLGKKLIYY